MPRRYYYRRSYGSRDKYSIEQAAGSFTTVNGDAVATIVPAANIQGMRKVKHITINLATNGTTSCYWAIVYVPGGTNANPLNVDGTTLYEPNQYVMNAGIYDAESGPGRVTSPLARNLNSGDSVVLVIKQLGATQSSYSYIARYAVTLQ